MVLVMLKMMIISVLTGFEIITYSFNGVSEGKQSYSRSSRWKGVSQEEADARIAKWESLLMSMKLTNQ